MTGTVIQQLYSATYLMYFLFQAFLHYKYEAHALIIGIGFLLHGIDFLISDRAWKNLEQVWLNGYSKPVVIFYQIYNLATYQLSWIIMTHMVLKDESLNKIPINWRLDASLVMIVVASLAIADVYFYWSHSWLHKSKLGANLHLLHHCCSDTTFSTGLCFNPLDLNIEFTGPVLVPFIVYYFLRDPCALMVTSCMIIFWYGASHDGYLLQIQHSNHHRYCDNSYAIYTQWRDPKNKDDAVRAQLKKLKKSN
jgi:sterol desaturase/sphingolipid hydroxylase (fatty acid hydroxylase superfamily)